MLGLVGYRAREGTVGYLYPSKPFVVKSDQGLSVRGCTALNSVIRRQE